ncbi:unnamed protein product, partial [marine sediment metagenome]
HYHELAAKQDGQAEQVEQLKSLVRGIISCEWQMTGSLESTAAKRPRFSSWSDFIRDSTDAELILYVGLQWPDSWAIVLTEFQLDTITLPPPFAIT